MGYHYAQVDNNGICCAVSELSSAVNSWDLIPTSSLDASVIGKRWNGASWDAVAPADTWDVSKLAFMDRFPRSKWQAAKAFAANNPGSDVAYFFERYAAVRNGVNLKDPTTILAINSLTDQAVPASFRLSQEEATAVIGVPANPTEFP